MVIHCFAISECWRNLTLSSMNFEFSVWHSQSQLASHIFSASNFRQLPFQHNCARYDPENLGHKNALTASQAPLRRIIIAQPHRRTLVAQTPRVFGTIFSTTGHQEVLWFSPWIKNSSIWITPALLFLKLPWKILVGHLFRCLRFSWTFRIFFLIDKIANWKK